MEVVRVVLGDSCCRVVAMGDEALKPLCSAVGLRGDNEALRLVVVVAVVVLKVEVMRCGEKKRVAMSVVGLSGVNGERREGVEGLCAVCVDHSVLGVPGEGHWFVVGDGLPALKVPVAAYIVSTPSDKYR